MANYSNLFLQALVEANERKTKEEKEEEKLLRDMAKEELEDDAAEEEKAEADAEAEDALEELGELSDDELDQLEQDELESDAEDIEAMEDPTDYDIDPDNQGSNLDQDEEDLISDEELAALEAEDDQEYNPDEEVPPDEVAPDGNPEAAPEEETIPPEEEAYADPEEVPDDQQPVEDETDVEGQIPEEGDLQDYAAEEPVPGVDEEDVPVDDGSGEMPDFDYDDGEEVPAEGEEGGEAAPTEEDPNAAPAEDAAGDPSMEEAPPDPALQNIQVNILNLSKLDRTIAKKHIYALMMDLRGSINTVLNIIDKNETVIDPAIREDAIGKINDLLQDLNSFISIKFQLINYEAALQSYMLFVGQFNDLVEYVKTGDIGNNSGRHKNKGDS